MSEPRIIIGTETEGANHWSYQVAVEDQGRSYALVVKLGWADYDLWSHGRVAPERVVRAALIFLLQREAPDRILTRFDCSLIRRYFPDVDQVLPTLL